MCNQYSPTGRADLKDRQARPKGPLSFKNRGHKYFKNVNTSITNAEAAVVHMYKIMQSHAYNA